MVLKVVDFLNVKLNPLTMDETVKYICTKVEKGEFIQHSVVNVAKLVKMQSDPLLNESVQSSDLINIDGMGVVWGARLCGHKVPERVAGVDLFYRLLSESTQKNFPVYLLGAQDLVLEKAVDVLRKEMPQLSIAGYHHGYFWEDELSIVQEIRQSGAKMLFVAITSPKKENFINKWQPELGVNFVMGVGGTFDIVAGKTRRAPMWMQEFGLEWLFRVIQEPRRMWRRYLITNMKFLILLLKEKSGSKFK